MVATLGKLFLQHVRGIGLGDQLRLEIQAWRHVPIGVTGSRITVDAPVLAAAIRVDRSVEGQVR
ncbi:hypothetical protein D3C81_1964310 [compost metagenome]